MPRRSPSRNQRPFIHDRLALEVLVAGKGERFSNTVKRVGRFLLMLRPFRAARTTASAWCQSLPPASDARPSPLPANGSPCGPASSAQRSRQLPSRSGLCVRGIHESVGSGDWMRRGILACSLLSPRTTPPSGDFVTESAQTVGQLGLIDGRGELLRGEEALRLNSARLAVVALGNVENDCVCVKLRGDVAINGPGCIVFKTWRR